MRYIIPFLLIFATLIANARQITSEEARSIASGFFNSGITSRSGTNKVLRHVVQAHRATASRTETQPYYIFNADGDAGFVIVSGDTRARKILGYSDNGCLNIENTPPQLKWLLGEYERQILALSGSASQDESWETNESPSTAGVLLKTANWNQGYPYNQLTPEINEEHAVTGCVATAMAIVMKYHSWPDHGRRMHSYTLNDGDGTVLSADFESATYDFGLMPDSCSGNEAPETVGALSTLLFHAGVSVDMCYSEFGSGASMWDVPTALKEFFRFDKTCQYLERDHFTGEAWNEMIKKQIDNGCPIIYSGEDDMAIGHAWILDGYAYSGDFYHFNWGWGGSGNGYLALSATGNGAYGTFPNRQGMVINIIPDPNPRNYSRAVIEYPYRSAGEFYLNVGLCVNVGNIEPNTPFDISTNQLFFPPGFVGFYGFAITDRNYNVREILWQEFQDCSQCNVYTVPLHSSATNVVSRLSNIDREDFLCVVTKEDGDSEWQIVEGTIEAPASIPVIGNTADITSVYINAAPNIQVNISKEGLADLDDINTKWENDIFSCLSGSQIFFRLSAPEGELLTFDLDGYFNGGVIDNRLNLSEFSENVYQGLFKTKNREYVMTAVCGSPITLSINNEEAGKFRTKISGDEARYVKNLSITGSMNVYDMWYINDYFQSLENLDLKNVNFDECAITGWSGDFYEYNINVRPIQMANEFPDWSLMELPRLKSVILPDNLKSIGRDAMFDNRLEDIVIPASVESIGLNFMNSYGFLKTITSLNTTPPVMEDLVGHFGESVYENATLFVPEESVKLYKIAPVWRNFSNIQGIASGSSISAVEAEDFSVRIYNLSGIIVFEGKYSEAKLDKGVYVIVDGDRAYKQLIN